MTTKRTNNAATYESITILNGSQPIATLTRVTVDTLSGPRYIGTDETGGRWLAWNIETDAHGNFTRSAKRQI